MGAEPIPPLDVLLIEDSPDDAQLVQRALSRAGLNVRLHRVTTAEAFTEALDAGPWSVVLADYYLPRFGALDALDRMRARGEDLPLIVVSGAIGEERAAEAMRRGAADYVGKGALSRLGPAIERELREAASRRSRRQTQRLLAQNKAYLQAVMDHVDLALFCLDGERLILTANATAGRLFGLGEDQLTHRPFDALFQERATEVGPGEYDRTAIRHPNASFDAEISVRPIALDGRPHFIASVRDVTVQRQLARQLNEQQSLARLGEMAAIIAHEVRNPLAGIRGAIKVLAGRLPDTGEERAVVGEILERIDVLNAVLEDLLLFARPAPPRPRPIPIASMLGDTVRLLREDPSWARIEVLMEQSDLVVPVDSAQLKPVFHNLLLNAAQAMGGQGTVRLRVESHGHWCRVYVEDDGPGIAAEVLPRVFEPFFTTKHRGTGLGLPIARRTVAAHGGRIAIDCPSDGGTRVLVELPLDLPDRPPTGLAPGA